jgi:hypothetical protein
MISQMDLSVESGPIDTIPRVIQSATRSSPATGGL